MRHILVPLLFVICTLVSGKTWAANELLVPATAPISFETESGTIKLSDYTGKVVLLDFWASWCGPCRQSFPWMNALNKQYSRDDLEVIAVNLDHAREDANEFLKELPADFKVVFDPSGKSAKQLEVMGMPMSYLIDSSGAVRHKLIGFSPKRKQKHEALIERLVAEKKQGRVTKNDVSDSDVKGGDEQ